MGVDFGNLQQFLYTPVGRMILIPSEIHRFLLQQLLLQVKNREKACPKKKNVANSKAFRK